jgi:hypothetical protein
VNTTHWNTKRETIYGWMVANNLKSYGDLYKGAVIILHDKPPGFVRFVAHAVRDLMNGMAAYKQGVTRKQVQYSHLVDTLLTLWGNHGLAKGPELLTPATPPDQQTIPTPVPPEIIVQIRLLFREHEDGRRRSDDSPYLFFQVFSPNSTSRDNIPEPYPKMWKELRRWFMDECHEGGTPPEQEVIDQIDSKFEQLEAILLSVADRYSNTILNLDEILDKANR